MIGKKYWNVERVGVGPPCLTCYATVTLEVWRHTNGVTQNAFSHTESIAGQFVRTLSAPTNLVLGTAPVGQWIPLPLTNSIRRLDPGEMLRLVSRSSATTNSGNIILRSEAVVRDAR